MGTTDRGTALEVLAAMTSAGFRWALLHGAAPLESGEGLSDVDIAVEPPGGTTLSRFIHELRDRSLQPLIVWPYGRAGVGTFIVRNDLSSGVQLDMLVDPYGMGSYGFRTSIAIDAAQLGPLGVPTLAPADSYLYTVRKRQRKHQHERLRELLEAPPADLTDLSKRTRAVFAEPHGAIVRALLAGRPLPVTHPRLGGDVARWVGRLVSPAGAQLHLSGPHGATAATILASQLRPILPFVDSVDTSCAAAIQRLPLIGPCPGTRWRAGLVISYGGSGTGATTQVQASQDPAVTAGSVTASLAPRAERHLRRWLARTSR